MSKKYTVDELLRLACIYAQQDRETLAGCCAEDDPAGIEARNLAQQIAAYRLKRWGKTKLESVMETMVNVPVQEFLKRGPTDKNRD